MLVAVRYLRKTGTKTASIVGGSTGGEDAGDASIASQPGQLARVVFLGAYPNGPAEKLSVLRYSYCHAMTQAKIDYVSPGFKSSTRKRPN